jgi:selenocysteine-specific elongation factor
MLDGKRISATGESVALAGWTVRVSNPDQALCDELLACFSRAGYSPPDTAQLAEQLKQPGARLQKLTQLLIDQGKLVRVDAALVLHREALEAAKAAALALFRKQPRFTTMEFRDALGVSRKYAVPVLDFLDKIRFTVRNGHDRTPGAEARKLLSP